VLASGASIKKGFRDTGSCFESGSLPSDELGKPSPGILKGYERGRPRPSKTFQGKDTEESSTLLELSADGDQRVPSRSKVEGKKYEEDPLLVKIPMGQRGLSGGRRLRLEILGRTPSATETNGNELQTTSRDWSLRGGRSCRGNLRGTAGRGKGEGWDSCVLSRAQGRLKKSVHERRLKSRREKF